MAFASYADLQANIATWLDRADLTANIPDFIVLFEANAARKLRVRPQETLTTLSTTAGSAALPSDYIGWRRVTWNGSTQIDLVYKHPSIIKAFYPSGTAGTPADFTIEASTLKVHPVDDTGIEFLYFAKTPALNSSLNWLYTNYPDIYLFGAMTEAKMFIEDPDGALVWKQRMDGVFDEIAKQAFREPGALQIQVMGHSP